MNKCSRIISSALTTWLAVMPLAAKDWGQWRGPTRDGISTESGWQDTWPANGPKIAWRTKVGLGFSSFVVAKGKAYTLGHADEKDTVFCFDLHSGKEVWKHSYAAELGDRSFDGGTTGTPTIDGDRLYTLNRWGETFCYNSTDGKILWSKNVQTETTARTPDWGFGGAPLVIENRVLLNVGEAGMALDPLNGKILWQSAPKSAGYSTPLPLVHGEVSLVVFGSAESYVAVNPRDGKEAWRIRWLTQYGVNAADPVVDGERVFLSTGYGKGGALFKVGKAEPEQVWKSKALRTQLNAAVLYQGHLFGPSGDTTEKAALKCVDFATGTERWTFENFGTGALVIADGKLLALSGAGELFVAPAVPESFSPTSRAQILGGKCWTAPVLADGFILGRNSKGEVVCLDVRKEQF